MFTRNMLNNDFVENFNKKNQFSQISGYTPEYWINYINRFNNSNRFKHIPKNNKTITLYFTNPDFIQDFKDFNKIAILLHFNSLSTLKDDYGYVILNLDFYNTFFSLNKKNMKIVPKYHSLNKDGTLDLSYIQKYISANFNLFSVHF